MRTVIEKFQRLDQIREQYAEEILAFAKTQLSIHQKVLKEFNLGGSYGEERDILHYDYLQIETGGSVGLWEHGRCGDSDSCLTSIYIDERILKGDLKGYEKYLRIKYAKQAEQVEIAAQKQKEAQREKLKKEIVRMSEELGKIS